ncbi:hypothetical protein AMTRI_Chr07g28390 [Amborella trichopoda]
MYNGKTYSFRPTIINNSFKKGEGVLENFKFDQERSRNELAKMIIQHNYPFRIVQHSRFRDFVKNVIEIYMSEKKRLHMELEKIPSHVRFTTNRWSSCRNQGYLCLTAHYIDESLSFATMLLDLLVHWKLEKKVFTVTLDNAAYNDVAASSL